MSLRILKVLMVFVFLLGGISSVYAIPTFCSTSNGQVIFDHDNELECFYTGDNNLFWSNSNKRLGIGANNPGAILHVNSSANPEIRLETITLTNYVSFNMKGPTYGWQQWMDNDDGKLRFWDNNDNIDRMVVDQSGNVGIGTINPSGKLEVNEAGSADLNTHLTARGANGKKASLAFNTKKTDGTNAGFTVQHDGSTDRFSIARTTGGAGNDFMIDGSGNVGIRTVPDPTYKFDVAVPSRIQTSTTSGIILRTLNNYGGLSINGVNDVTLGDYTSLQSHEQGSLAARSLAINAASGEIDQLWLSNSSSRVGIDTYQPATTLDVNGPIRTRQTTRPTCDSSIAGTIDYEESGNVGTFYGCRKNGVGIYEWVALN